MTRPSFGKRTSYKGQIIGGRDGEMMAIIPTIRQESELGEEMRAAEKGKFTFTFTLEDEKRLYHADVDIHTSLEDSTGGNLRSEEE